MKRPLLIASAVIATSGLAGIGSVTLASADSPTGGTPAHSTIHHPHKDHDDHGIRLQARLNQAVRDGTITDTQKTAFLNELKSLRAEHKADISKTSTKDQRKAERTKLHDELQAWAKANNFPLDKLMPRAAQGNS